MHSSQGGSVVRVLVADHHALVRGTVCDLLRTLPGVRVVGEAANGEHAVAQCEALRPDVVFIDLAMPVLGGLDATTAIRRAYPGTQVIVLSMNGAREYVIRALEAGAAGYLLKGADVGEFRQALAAVRHGMVYLSPRLPDPPPTSG